MGLGRFKSKKSCRQPGGEHRKKSDMIAELLKFYINLCASQCISHSWKPYRKPETLRGSSYSNLVMFGLPLGKGGNVRTATEQVGGHSLGTLTEKDTFQMANDMTSNVITMMRMITNSSGLIPVSPTHFPPPRWHPDEGASHISCWLAPGVQQRRLHEEAWRFLLLDKGQWAVYTFRTTGELQLWYSK